MSTPVLALDGVTVRAGGRTILDVPTFTIAARETVALLGANGAGKTTLLHVAALLKHPDTGRIAIQGQFATPENAAALRRSLSVVFQDPLLFDVDVLSNAAAGLRFHGVPRAEAERRAGEWLSRFGVGHLASRRARSLSGGEAGRVALARAFATEPSLLLLDEPFAALDAPTRAALLPELRQSLHDTGAAALLVSHDLSEAFAFGDRIALMHDGTILAGGIAAELIAHPPSRDVAALLGVENILPARVSVLNGDLASVNLRPDGPMVRVRIDGELALAVGQAVTFTLPAPAARVLSPNDETPAGWNVLRGRLTAANPLPSGTRMTVAIPVPVVGLAPWNAAHSNWRIGDCAQAAFPPEAGHIIVEGRNELSLRSPGSA